MPTQNRIEIRGLIAMDQADREVSYDLQDRGVVTLESTVRAGIANADPTADLVVYVNSRGGSVFAAHEITNALREWRAETGKQIILVVGSIAASAAANLVALLEADTVHAHENSIFMFHSARVPDSADPVYSELIAKTNAAVQEALTTRYGIDPAAVEMWFSATGAGWMNAQDAKRTGLVDKILGPSDSVVDVAAEDVALLADTGLDIAAALEGSEPPTDPTAFYTVPPPQLHRFTAAALAEHDQAIGAEAVATLQATLDGVAAARDGALELQATTAGLLDTARGDLTTVRSELETLQGTLTTAEAARAAAVTEGDSLRAQLDRLTDGLHGGGDGGGAIATWADAMAALGYEAARKQHPELYAAFMQANG